jgi:hypothetical protein
MRSKSPDVLNIWGITWTKTKWRRGWLGPAITVPEDPMLARAVECQRIIRRDGRYVMVDPSITLDRFGWDEDDLTITPAPEAEEVGDLGSSVQHAIESHLERLLLHLLKRRYDPAQEPRRDWRLTIRHARREIAKYLRRNPGLQHHPAHYLAEACDAIREDAAIDTEGLACPLILTACTIGPPPGTLGTSVR